MTATPAIKASITINTKNGTPVNFVGVDFLPRAKILLLRGHDLPAATESVSIEGELFTIREVEAVENSTRIVRLAKAD
jgi:hypothetical protein